jgi:hypothetical protein
VGIGYLALRLAFFLDPAAHVLSDECWQFPWRALDPDRSSARKINFDFSIRQAARSWPSGFEVVFNPGSDSFSRPTGALKILRLLILTVTHTKTYALRVKANPEFDFRILVASGRTKVVGLNGNGVNAGHS